MTTLPVIGITLDSEEPGGYSKFPWYALRQNYCGAVAQAGGLPVPLPHEPELADPTAHAEMLALRAAAAQLGQTRLEGCDLYVTLEPCPMCAAAISLARIRRLFFAAYDPKGGGVEHGAKVYDHATCHHRPEVVGGLGESAAADVLRAFFRERR